MSNYNSIEEMMKDIQAKAKESLKTDVGKLVQEKIQQHVISDVYNTYKPKKYLRSYEIGELGLGSIENIIVNETSDGIEVVNITEHDGKDISYVVESGIGYDYDYPYGYNKPRPFLENASKELEQSQGYVKVFKESMSRKGIQVI